jgi:hypothetical protein
MGFVTAGCATKNSSVDLNNLSRNYDLSKLSRKQVVAYNANPENTDKIVCTTEKPIGSNIPKRVCYWESKIKDRQNKDQQSLREIKNNAPPMN